jgi:taurine dioxygenase
MWFHHDTSYYPEPHRATLLFSMKLPSWGGNTCFSNMYRAYENIPQPLRDKLEGKKVLQVHDYKRRERLDLDAIDLDRVRHHEQPIFITHPATGRSALYQSADVGPDFGLPREERTRAGAALRISKSRRSSTSTNGSSATGDLGTIGADPRPQGFPRDEPVGGLPRRTGMRF